MRAKSWEVDENAERILASGGPYAALAALTNIPATMVGVLLYELFLADSQRGSFFVLQRSRRLIIVQYFPKPRWNTSGYTRIMDASTITILTVEIHHLHRTARRMRWR